jgi:hypothetical protein
VQGQVERCLVSVGSQHSLPYGGIEDINVTQQTPTAEGVFQCRLHLRHEGPLLSVQTRRGALTSEQGANGILTLRMFVIELVYEVRPEQRFECRIEHGLLELHVRTGSSVQLTRRRPCRRDVVFFQRAEEPHQSTGEMSMVLEECVSQCR